MELLSATKIPSDPQQIEKMLKNSAQDGLEPDYEILKRHIEVWIKRNPEEAKEFFQYRKDIHNNSEDKSGPANLRATAAIPPTLWGLLHLLAPNIVGSQELTPDAQRKRLHKFLKHFPMFKMVEKL